MFNEQSDKIDITQFHFSAKLDITDFFRELEAIPVGDVQFDHKVLLLKIKHGLISEFTEEDMNRVIVRCWKSIN